MIQTCLSMESMQRHCENWPYRHSFHGGKCLSCTITTLFTELWWRSANITGRYLCFQGELQCETVKREVSTALQVQQYDKDDTYSQQTFEYWYCIHLIRARPLNGVCNRNHVPVFKKGEIQANPSWWHDKSMANGWKTFVRHLWPLERVRVRVRKLYLKSDNVNNVTLALIWNEC